MTEGIHACGRDTDEARGLALTFLAAVVGALLEIEPRRTMHKEQLEAARELERLTDPTSIALATVARVRRLTDSVVHRTSRTGDAVIDRALEIMARSFTAEMDADSIARELNLSTSHFRYLFREATRQPFHKYLVSMRLEKARELLLQTDIPVTQIADHVGFLNPAHFSRAFSKRFGVAPSALRQSRR
jgi:transcriptional regulator GlxA family with amidase domain